MEAGEVFPTSDDLLPQFTVDAREALQPYFAKLRQNPGSISPKAFELVFLTWLTDIAGPVPIGSNLTPRSHH